MSSSSGMLRRATPSPPAPLRSDVAKQQQRGSGSEGTVAAAAAAAAVPPLHWPATLPPYRSPSPSTSSASPLLPATPGAHAGAATASGHLCSSCCDGSCAGSSSSSCVSSWPSSSPLFAAVLYALSLGLATFGNEWSTRIGRDLVRSEADGAGAAGLAAVRAPAVYDLGRSLLPALDGMVWLPDLLLIPMFIVAAVMLTHKTPAAAHSAALKHVASVATAAPSRPAKPSVSVTSSFVRRASLLVCLHAYVLLLRTVSVCVTILGASPRCQQQSLLHASNAGFVLNSGCFDLMFSGHSSFAALIATVALWSGALARPTKTIVVLLGLLAALANVLVGDHYSADVWLGVYVGASIAAMHRHEIRAAFA